VDSLLVEFATASMVVDLGICCWYCHGISDDGNGLKM
jgi:hypothetical protein